MKRVPKIPVLGVALACLVGVAQPASAGRARVGEGKAPRLVLLIVVDQLRWDYLERFPGVPGGGFARIQRSGASFTNAHLEHVPTATAVGHSAMLTGAPPIVSGIVGNYWYDRATRTKVGSVADSSTRGIGAEAVPGASPWRLLVSSIGDELKLAGRGSKVIGVSFKDRTAILPPGRMADGAFWWHGESGRFVSSTWYGESLPAWVEAFNARGIPDSWAGRSWGSVGDAKAPAFVTLATEPGPTLYDQIYRSPFANDLLESLAEAALDGESLGQDEETDVLTVSFSSNDPIGHTYGPHSAEVRDATVRTDAAVGRLLDAVEQRVGLARTLIILTSDHGVAPVPEEAVRRGLPGGRIGEKALGTRADEVLDAAFGTADWIEFDGGGVLYLDHAVIRRKDLDVALVERVVAEALAEVPSVWRVFSRSQLVRGRVPDDPWSRRLERSFHPGRSGDILVFLHPYWLVSNEVTGSSHGTPFSYDTHVPLVLSGWGVRRGRHHGNVSMNDLAPTLATLLRIETPSGSSGRVLTEALSLP